LRRYLAILAAFTIVVLGACGTARAQMPDPSTPDGLVKSIVADMMTDLSGVKLDRDGVTAVVTHRFLPYIDFQRATRLAMGRAYLNATPDQRARSVDQFTRLFIHDYSIWFVRGLESVDYKPLRAAPDATDVIVHSKQAGGGTVIHIDYRLTKVRDGWRVYDVGLSDTWLVQTYQQKFSVQISQRGIDGLIEFLDQRNQQLAGGR
jgi:phospholipid transport system substrate-binding protein